MLLEDKAAIVTGGAMGIGKGIALKFAAEGCDVVIVDISDAEGNKTADEVSRLGRTGIYLRCDITDSRQVQDMVQKAIDRFGKVDILVNNAGGVLAVHPGGSIVDITDEQWEKVIDLNLKSAFLCCRALATHMKERKYGKIINLSSIGFVQPSDSVIHYHCAKGGVVGLTTNLAFDMAPFNVNVNAIMPGPIRTPFWEPITRNIEDKDAFFAEIGRQNVPLQRIGTPEDIAGAALFLASELSSYVTGEVIAVAGGIPLLPQNPERVKRGG